MASPEREYIMNLSDDQIKTLIKLASAQANKRQVKQLQHCEGNNNSLETLDSLVGLSEPKTMVKKIIAFHTVNKIASERGHASPDICRHMVFTGNPGTAKTTVARLFAAVCKEKHLLDTGVFIEVSRADLVSKYASNTAEKTSKVIKRAAGGILFVDEAYTLDGGKQDGYGEEAINTINIELENCRHNTIVIFAGYPDRMESFLDRNPGIRSRILTTIHFPDYSEDELVQIAEIVAQNNGYHLTDEARKKLHIVLENALHQENFGNGRYSRKLIENAMMNHAFTIFKNNLETSSDDVLFCLNAEDITPVGYVAESVHRKIGFFQE